MDPESGLDDVRNVGVTAGTIVAISALPLNGRASIDVGGLVVAPGFIDLHAHGQDDRSARLQAQDGVTTALDMESGVFPVDGWYRSREGSAPINFGPMTRGQLHHCDRLHRTVSSPTTPIRALHARRLGAHNRIALLLG
jgi:hypothetical protein